MFGARTHLVDLARHVGAVGTRSADECHAPPLVPNASDSITLDERATNKQTNKQTHEPTKSGCGPAVDGTGQ